MTTYQFKNEKDFKKQIEKTLFKKYWKDLGNRYAYREKLYIEAIKYDWTNIKYIENPSREIYIEAFSQSPNSLKLIKNQTEEMYLDFVSIQGGYLNYIKNPSEDVIIKALEQNSKIFKYFTVEQKTEKVCLKAVELDGLNIQYINNPTDDIKYISITNNPLAIKYITSQTEDLCLKAIQIHFKKLLSQYISSGEIIFPIKRNPKVYSDFISTALEKQRNIDDTIDEMLSILKFINIHTDKICRYAIKQNIKALQYLKNPSEEICYEALNKDVQSLYNIKNQSLDFYINVIHNYKKAINYLHKDVWKELETKQLLHIKNDKYLKYKYNNEWYLLPY